MATSQTLTTPEVKRRIKDIHEGRFKLISAYNGARQPIKLQCTRCKHIRTISGGNALRRNVLKCPSCEYGKTGPRTRTKDDWQRRINARHGKGIYTLVGKTDENDRYTVRHSCGKTFIAKPGDMLRPVRPPSCPCEHKRVISYTLKTYNQHLNESRPGYVCLAYNKQGKNRYRHDCGTEWEATRSSFTNAKYGCPACYNEARKINLTEVQIEVDTQHPGEYTIQKRLRVRRDDGKHSDQVLVRHNECGEIYNASIRGLRNGQARCPVCYPNKGASRKIIRHGKHTFTCQGYEPHTLKWLLKRGVHPRDIVTGCDRNRLRIVYPYGEKRSDYFPDFWLPSRNTIIEVKSFATLGLVPSAEPHLGYDLLPRNQAKALECKHRGYRFILHLYHGGKRVKIPPNWEHMRREALLDALR